MARRVIGVYNWGDERALLDIPDTVTSQEVAEYAPQLLRSHMPAWIRVRHARVTYSGDVRITFRIVLSRALVSRRFWREMAHEARRRLRAWWKGDAP